MDEDPKTAGGVGDGVAPIEPVQSKQTVMPENATSGVARADSEPTISVRGATPVNLGGTQPTATATNTAANSAANTAATSPGLANSAAAEAPAPGGTDEHPNRSQHIDHDLKLTGVKKSHKLAATLAIFAGIVVLMLGGFAAWFFAYYNQPEKVALDAIENFFKADNVTMDGGFAVIGGENSVLDSVIVNLKSSSRRLPNATDVDIAVSSKSNGAHEDAESINLSLGSVMLDDGVAYLQVEGLEDTVKTLFNPETGIPIANTDAINSFAHEIDDDWWQISMPELLSALEAPETEANFYSAIYSCGVDAVQSDYGGEFAALYHDHPFVKVESVSKIEGNDGTTSKASAGHGYYEIGLDSENLAAFVNAIPTTSTAGAFYDCYNSAAETYSDDSEEGMVDEISAENFSEVSAEDFKLSKDLHLYLEISRFGHRLRSLTIMPEIPDHSGFSAASGSVLFSYKVPEEPVAPEEYGSTQDLVQNFKELFAALAGAPVLPQLGDDPDLDYNESFGPVTGDDDEDADDSDYDDYDDDEDEV